MKIMIIHVGNFTHKDDIKSDVNYFEEPTILHDLKLFDEPQVINNVQTRKSIEKSGYEVVYFFHTDRNSIYGLIKSGFKIRNLYYENEPDLTHIYWGGISALILVLFLPGKKIVSLLGSDLFGSYSDNKYRTKTKISYIQTFSSKILSLICDATIVMSNSMKNYLWNSNSKKINVIPEGISINKFYPIDKLKSRKFLKWNIENFVLIFFYQGQAVKNSKFAYSVVEELRKEIKNLDFKIISGYRHEDLKYVYNAADCMIITSFHEGSNNSIKEAMCCNLPIVSVPCGDAEERLKNVKNSYVTDYNLKLMSNKVLKIFKSKTRSNGTNFINEFTLDHCANKVSKLYKKV